MQSPIYTYIYVLAPLSLMGIFATLIPLFHLRFHSSYNGYLRLLLKHPPWSITSCVFLLWLASGFLASFAFVAFGYPVATGSKWLAISIGSGVAAALGSGFLEIWVCKRVGFKSWALPTYRALRRINLAPFHPVAWQLNRFRQRDNLGWQQRRAPEWDFGVSKVVIFRRIRMLFGETKPGIAAGRRQPEFLSFDINITPPVQFFLLLDYYGRRRVNELLKDSVQSPRPCRDWNGHERRRHRGSPEDRQNEPLDLGLIRMSDRPILVEDVKRGKLPAHPH
jgi:hypothetical protein